MENSNTLSSSSGVRVVGSDAPPDYHMTHRTSLESNPTNHLTVSAPPPIVAVSTPSVSVTPTPLEAGGVATLKKKRGRPRRYAPDGSPVVALSPKPISSAAPPPVIDFSSAAAVEKRGVVRPVMLGSAAKLQIHRAESESLGNGESVSCSVGPSFTPHILTVNAGEDVMMKVISFSQQGHRAICILSANGVISSVTLRQPDSAGGTLTYEGRFEIVSLNGSFTPNDSGGMRNRSGGMSVSLASPDGRVVGGGVAGLLVAATPVQIVVGSFVAGNQNEQQKTKKHKPETMTMPMMNHPAAAIPISSPGLEDNNNKYHSWSKTDINVTLPAGP
ncbi:hypothetical protein CASFOL_036955 [Castilleja foliolosa]|uniref:AT-hook motif nuclear-localized protein n=1 Tax=Castilleja foliolosa TaxID=1961234 RepID=A0ABD3BPL4_9LAMI